MQEDLQNKFQSTSREEELMLRTRYRERGKEGQVLQEVLLTHVNMVRLPHAIFLQVPARRLVDIYS